MFDDGRFSEADPNGSRKTKTRKICVGREGLLRSPDQMINAHAKPSAVSDFLTDNDTAIHAFKNLTWRDVLNYV